MKKHKISVREVKAKSVRKNKLREIDRFFDKAVIMAWLDGSVAVTQIAKALGYSNAAAGGSTVYSTLMGSIRHLYNTGKIKIN